MKQFKVLDYDIIYLSYDEPNAEENYTNLLTKVPGKTYPWCRRILMPHTRHVQKYPILKDLLLLTVTTQQMNNSNPTINFFQEGVDPSACCKLDC